MDNFDKILDLIENPGKYTDKEIDAILADPETRALYESLSAMAGGHFASGLPDGAASSKSKGNRHGVYFCVSVAQLL